MSDRRFDPAAYIKDLQSVGCMIRISTPVPPNTEAPYYFVCPPEGRSFDRRYRDVIEKWSPALGPEHVYDVMAYVDAIRAATVLSSAGVPLT